MNVLITNANKDTFIKIDSKLKFNESTVNTSYFTVSPARFERIRTKLREMGINPYAVMYW